jgi:hypothetical protein
VTTKISLLFSLVMLGWIMIAGNGSTAGVPEPTSLLLQGLGSACLVARRLKKRQNVKA